MAERTKIDSPPPEPNGDDPQFPGDTPPGRSHHVIAFGIVAVTAMIFGFLLGLLF